MSEVYIVSAVRTPIGAGRPTGALQPLAPVDLAAQVLQEAVKRAGVDPGRVEDVIWGCVTPLGDQGANLGRLAVLKAGFPVQVPGLTLSRMCGSGQQAVHFAAQAILAGDMELVVAGGTEMMSHQPLGSDYPARWPDLPYELVHQGISAERMAQKWGLSRTELDDYSYESHLRAMRAIQAGLFEAEILPVTLPNGRVFAQDEGVRMPPDREKMAALKPVFLPEGVVTAGNSSQISDGAAALVLASPKAVGRYNLSPLARVAVRNVVGSDPVLMLDGPIPATRQVLQRLGLSLGEIQVVEINEAFASVVLAWARELDADLSCVNPNGGAIAHGHPLGATGAVLMTKLVHELQRRKATWGLQTMCIGHGMATATILERILMPLVYLALGTNLGDRLANLTAAVEAMPPAVRILARSPVYETAPWGYADQPDFLNQVVEAETDLSPHDLLAFLKRVEGTLGRRATFRYGPRLIDLDILFYDDMTLATPTLAIPHPRLAARAFVLRPLADLAPSLLHPALGKTVAELLQAVETGSSQPLVQLFDLDSSNGVDKNGE